MPFKTHTWQYEKELKELKGALPMGDVINDVVALRMLKEIRDEMYGDLEKLGWLPNNFPPQEEMSPEHLWRLTLKRIKGGKYALAAKRST